MTPGEILSGCSRDGIELRLTNDGMIRYSGDEYSLKYWLPILAAHKTSVVAELSLEPFTPELEIIRCCQDCRHFATPGKSEGYCGQRQDLPPAYGINHPLKRLPPDKGESCDEYIPGDWVQP
jgi:hypothetical protein